ncbi:hypothetical protein OEZ85_009269 [Tetradesmus obliquus]|uniref:Uncharacterized protein n=1 Tax=Tetradesmus obliquus TaxID=3088 RepID=A0ABY8U8G1_TETOB|nr:hypothetical protein OEZ85_009269 [Tetradesmus obliquus]
MRMSSRQPGQALLVTPSAAAAGHMMSLRWFKGPDGDPFQVQCAAGIHIPRIADTLDLKASGLKLNGVVVDFNGSTGYMLDIAFLADLGATRESAIQVTGQPAALSLPCAILFDLCCASCRCFAGLLPITHNSSSRTNSRWAQDAHCHG